MLARTGRPLSPSQQRRLSRLVGEVPRLCGIHEAWIVDAVARASYDEAIGRERSIASPAGLPVAPERGFPALPCRVPVRLRVGLTGPAGSRPWPAGSPRVAALGSLGRTSPPYCWLLRA